MNKQQLKENLKDQKWRLNNLYHIINETGKRVKFKMRPIQEKLYDEFSGKNVIVKGRQIGITTLMCIWALDTALFGSDEECAILAQTEGVAKKLFKDNIKFAYDKLPEYIKDAVGRVTMNNTQEMEFANGSSIYAGITTRSGTTTFLHVTELGILDYTSPEKAREIRSGALNTVHKGSKLCIESTVKQSTGVFADIAHEAKENELKGTDLTTLDYKLHWFPWYDDPKYSYTDAETKKVVISKETHEYFDVMQESIDYKFSPNQIAWYQKKKKEQRGDMMREFPCTFDEAFSTPSEDAYYGKEMRDALVEGRIKLFTINKNFPVHTAWDIGVNDANVIIFFQYYDGHVWFVDCYMNKKLGLDHYVKVMEKKDYRYGTHYLPHDVGNMEFGSGSTRLNTLYNLGVRNVIVQKKHNEPGGDNFVDGIDAVRSRFHKFVFNNQNCLILIKAMREYRQRINLKSGATTGQPVKDKKGTSDLADAVRVLVTTFIFVEERLMIKGFGDESSGNNIKINSFF